MDFNTFLNEEKNKEYFKNLMHFIDDEYKNYTCYPKKELIFNAINLTDFSNLKVIIIGQDPYHEINQAHGLAFSTLDKKLPPSLKNIYKEMALDLNVEINQDGNLEYLAKQGVLLLNTILTVREGAPLSHQKRGWEIFTGNLLKFINANKDNLVCILWGNNAIRYKDVLNNKTYLILEGAHPSPLSASRGFFGNHYFSRCNEYLKEHKIKEISWYKKNRNLFNLD